MMSASRLALIAALALLAGCQTQPSAEVPAEVASSEKSAALRNMEQVAIAAHRCWFASRDPVFAGYSFANELNSFSGQPRFLLVPRGDFGGRPLLVVQASGAAGTVTSFGPLLDGAAGPRIRGDIARFASGDASCGTSA
ncbi:hypothetical protein D5400_11180 [Georhizobium profundi]|jgi:hypothetical protein|uniref:Lipoprotein n=1 Tax=Georhizobium profundi TaxID=2341112 RepID=A0A3Q8XR54_9HYPH|nr:hypothetical protein [Georhizobium profundi]AZN71760.1 hypothetical protein D5400_11180 [Georhizobium profundi]